MGTLITLASRMKKLKTSVPQRASDRAVVTAFAIVKELTQNTPVDTSEALSNWQIGLDSPPDMAIGPHVAGQAGSTSAQSEKIAQEIAFSILPKKLPGQAIYISNTAAYVRALNTVGGSIIRAGFVERSVAIGRRKARNKTKVL